MCTAAAFQELQCHTDLMWLRTVGPELISFDLQLMHQASQC